MRSSFGWEVRSIAALLVVAFAVQSLPLIAADEADAGPLATMKTGLCKFKILASDGIKPLSGAILKATAGNDEKKVFDATADKSGKCGITLPAGRFVISINDRNVSILDITDDAVITECRIIIPEEALQVGGDPKTATVGKKKAAAWISGGTAKWVVVGSILVIGGVIYTVTDDDDESDGGPSPQ